MLLNTGERSGTNNIREGSPTHVTPVAHTHDAQSELAAAVNSATSKPFHLFHYTSSFRQNYSSHFHIDHTGIAILRSSRKLFPYMCTTHTRVPCHLTLPREPMATPHATRHIFPHPTHSSQLSPRIPASISWNTRRQAKQSDPPKRLTQFCPPFRQPTTRFSHSLWRAAISLLAAPLKSGLFVATAP